MPEGVEVRLLAEEINNLITGSQLIDINILSGRYKNKPPIGYKSLKQILPLRIISVNIKGKFMWWKIGDKNKVNYIMFTLGLSGGWTVMNTNWNRLEFVFNVRGKHIKLFLFDIRNFATMKISNEQDLQKKINKLGIDMFSTSWTQENFLHELNKRPNETIAESLLGQQVVSGPGTYIITESLYEARISPSRKNNKLSRDEMSRIYNAIRNISYRSYRANRDVISIYKLRNDIKVENIFKFNIYNKKTDIKGNKIKIYSVNNRNIKWVPKIQS